MRDKNLEVSFELEPAEIHKVTKANPKKRNAHKIKQKPKFKPKATKKNKEKRENPKKQKKVKTLNKIKVEKKGKINKTSKQKLKSSENKQPLQSSSFPVKPKVEATKKEKTTKRSVKKGNERKKNREKYLKLVISEIEKHKFYPLMARRLGVEGKVKLLVEIDGKGNLANVKVLHSDSKLLSKAAKETLSKCKFPPPPSGKFSGEIIINYELK